tara:strand:+ start:80 stop:448 length:369 start_codon:yes stop_codon:yes gene_type:complete
MKFAVYQIILSKADADFINAGNPNDKFSAQLKMSMDFSGDRIGGLASDAFDAGLYTHVANITAENNRGCFEVGNIGPESSIERLSRMTSLSVGNVIVDEDGTAVVVASEGFVAFAYNPKMAA